MSKSKIYISDKSFELNNSNFSVIPLDDMERTFDVMKISDNEFSVILDNQSFHLFLHNTNGSLTANVNNRLIEIQHVTLRDMLLQKLQNNNPDHAKTETFRAPMPGLIAKILESEGSLIGKDEGVIVIEAMKMENEIISHKKGIITKIFVNEKQTVEKNDQLFTIEYS